MRKYFEAISDLMLFKDETHAEMLMILPEIIEYSQKNCNFCTDFVEKCEKNVQYNGKLPESMYNSLVQIYYKFGIDKRSVDM